MNRIIARRAMLATVSAASLWIVRCNSQGCGPSIVCGNSSIELTEQCDDGGRNSNDWALTRHCNASCSGYAPYCGDGATNGSESCDEGSLNGQTDHCKSDCSGIPPTGSTETRMCPYRQE